MSDKVQSAQEKARALLRCRDGFAGSSRAVHRALLVDNGERGSAQKAVTFDADDLSALMQDYAALERELAEAQAHDVRNLCITEAASFSPSIAEYVRHWEGRAELAEAKLTSEGVRHEAPEELSTGRCAHAECSSVTSSPEVAGQASGHRAWIAPSCRVGADGREVSQVSEADIDAARDIIAEGRASHVGWAEHLKRCPGCEQCKTLGIDWGWEREQSWVERYDFLLGVIDSFAALRQQHAEDVDLLRAQEAYIIAGRAETKELRQRHAAEVVKAIKFGFGFNASNADRAVEFYELEAECLAVWRQEEEASDAKARLT